MIQFLNKLLRFSRITRKNKRYFLAALLVVSVITIRILLPEREAMFYVFREPLHDLIEKTIEEALKEDKGTGCDIPYTDPFAKEIMQFVKESTPIKCDGKDWVRCYQSTCKPEPSILQSVKDLECFYSDIIYITDMKRELTPPTVLKGDHEYKLNASDHVEIFCRDASGGNGIFSRFFQKSWGGYGAGLRPLHPKEPPKGREKTYNVLIFAFDSTSKNGFIRKMSKSYEYLKEEFVILQGFNIVGDGTPGALFPLLTGRTELELPDARRWINGSGNLDHKALIFYKLKEDGYRTAYLEDMPQVGTFQRRHNGFKTQPADHYLRHFFQEHDNRKKRFGVKSKIYCIGDTPSYQLMMNLTDQLFQRDGKKFAFTFVADICHDDFNVIGSADEPFRDFIRGFMRQHRRDTLLIVMGDHGPRYTNLRATLQGKIEERLPLMAIHLPDDLLEKRPNALTALRENANVLTTYHDLHTTIFDVVDMRQHWNTYKVKGADLTRGLTLLEPIPKNRSCSEAGLQPHWCVCLKWEQLASTDPLYTRTAEFLVDHINKMTEFVRNKCAIRTLTSIAWVMRKQPNKRMLSFKESKDRDDYTGSFNAKAVSIDKQVYQIKVEVGPGKGVYEASVMHVVKQDKLVINDREISRTNRYNDEPACVSATYPHLSPYCYCVN